MGTSGCFVSYSATTAAQSYNPGIWRNCSREAHQARAHARRDCNEHHVDASTQGNGEQAARQTVVHEGQPTRLTGSA